MKEKNEPASAAAPSKGQTAGQNPKDPPTTPETATNSPPPILKPTAQEYLEPLNELLLKGLQAMVVDRPPDPLRYLTLFLKDRGGIRSPDENSSFAPLPPPFSCGCVSRVPIPPCSCGCLSDSDGGNTLIPHMFPCNPLCIQTVEKRLGDERDITLRGLEIVRKCEKVYLEAYTSLLALGIDPQAITTLEKLYGRSVTIADREMVEQRAQLILNEAQTSDVAFLVVGDPFGATTHSDLVVRAKTLGVKVEVVHNASIMNAVGACGLQLYRFGEAISIPFFTETWRPESFYDKIKANRSIGLHTLCLLDIRVKEPSVEALCRGRKEYEPPRFMSVNTAVEQLLEVEERRQENVYNGDTMAVGIARLGQPTQLIVAAPLKQLLHVDFGDPLHSLVIAGKMHVVEEEMLSFFRV